MAEDKDLNSSNHCHNGEDGDDDLNVNGEYLPNVVRLEPDIGLGNRTRGDRKRQDADGNQRREEGPISFRHFLRNDAGPSSSTCPDLYSCSRQDRLVEGAVIDPESPDLPDFVQDHLAVEHMYFNDASPSSTVNLPDFASFMPRNNDNDAHRSAAGTGTYAHGIESRRSSRNRVPLDLPVPNFIPVNETQPQPGSSLPFDLTTGARVAACSSEVHSPVATEMASTGGGLPDFLSDGHILGRGNARHRDARIVTSENGNTSEEYIERHNLIIMLRQENNRLRDESSVLQSIIMKKDDRIKELEDLVMALEISKLQMSSDANTQTMNKVAPDDEVVALKRELEHSKNEILKLQKEKLSAFAEMSQKNSSSENRSQINANLALKIKEMTSVSERLVRELLQIITDMRADVHSNDLLQSPEKNARANEDLENTGSAGPSAP